MEITKLSSKGQVVIPESARQNLKIGTAFTVVRKGDLIILKEVEGLKEEEIKEMKELDKIWKEIDEGKATTQKVEDFLDEMKRW